MNKFEKKFAGKKVVNGEWFDWITKRTKLLKNMSIYEWQPERESKSFGFCHFFFK